MIYTDLPLQPPDQGQISAWTKWKVLDLLREEKDYMLQVLKEWANLNQQEPGSGNIKVFGYGALSLDSGFKALLRPLEIAQHIAGWLLEKKGNGAY